MDQELTAEQVARLDSHLRVVTARFRLQLCHRALSDARDAVNMARGAALQEHCKALLARADFAHLLDRALSKVSPNTVDGLIAAFRQAADVQPAPPTAPSEDHPELRDDAAAQPLETGGDVLSMRKLASARRAELDLAAATCLRAWLEVLVSSSPWDAWVAAGQLVDAPRYDSIHTIVDLLERFNNKVPL